MLYYQYFRLKGAPFQAASPEGPVYFSPTHLAGLATLESGLSGDLTGLTMLTGEVGTGKTTLIYSLLQKDYKRVRVAHIDDPKLSFIEILQVILSQLNLYSTGTTKLDYLEALDRFVQLRGKDERIAIVVDEAQALSDDVLEELRLLSSHGQRYDRGLQLILVGQPELAERLKKPELRQLNQRISSRGVLKPLSYAQAVNYVECRLIAQGGKASAIFAPRALKHLLRRSDGIPRKVNVLCHTAMQAAFYAGEKKVSAKTAKKIAAEYHDSVKIIDQGFSAWVRRIGPAFVVGAGLAWLLVLTLGFPKGWLGRAHHTHSPARVAEQAAVPVKPATQLKTAAATKAVAQSNVATRPDSAAKPKDAAASESGTSLTAAAAAASKEVAAGNGGVGGKAEPGKTSVVANAASGAPGASAADSKQSTAAEALERRGQITVKYGDTLEKIAVRYLGSKTAIDQLVRANPQLSDINQLNVGEAIYLPPGVVPSKAVHDETAATTPPDAKAEDPQR